MLLRRDMVGCGEIEDVRTGEKKHRNFEDRKTRMKDKVIE